MMKSSYKDRELPEAFKKNMKKKADKEARYGSAKDCPKCKGDKKKCPGGKACPMTAKKDMGRGGPYADGMCGKRGDIASAFNEVLIEDDEEIERSDKKCGNSGIPDNAKCTKSTTAPKSQRKSGNNLGNIAGGAAALGLIYGGFKYAGEQQRRSKHAKSALAKIKKLKAKGNDAFVASLKGAKNTQSLAQLKAFEGQEQSLLEKAQNQVREGFYTRQMARGAVKSALGDLKKLVPKSAARRRKAKRKPVTGGIANRGVTGIARRN